MTLNPTTAYSTFSAAYSIGFSQRPQLFNKSESPGPQAYSNLNQNVSKMKSPEWRISESKKVSIFDVNQINPSGSDYKIPSSIGQGLAYSIRNPTGRDREVTKPSPALQQIKFVFFYLGDDIYTPNLDIVKKTLPSISLTSRATPNFKKTYEETPGPGAYDTIYTDINGQRKNKGRSEMQNEFKNKQKKEKLEHNHNSTSSFIYPAPNQYQVTNPSQISSPSFKFQQSRRKELINQSYENNGPASYNINRDFVKQSPHHSFSQTKQTEFHSNGLMKSMSEQKFDSIPGPGAYEHNLPSLFSSTYYKSQKFGLAERKIDMAANCNSPGPGAYSQIIDKNENKLTSRSNTFGESKKNTGLQVSSSPGPGSYNIPDQIGNGPKYVINKSQQKLPSFIRKSDNPGPAAYIISEDHTKPSPYSVKFNSKTEGNESNKNITPGPGHYNIPEDSFRNTKISFTTNGVRDAFGINKEGPGPASYEIKSQVAGLPDYHQKQIEYFKVQIKHMRESMSNTSKTLRSSTQRSQKPIDQLSNSGFNIKTTSQN